MPVVGSEGQPAVPAQLSVRRGRAASEFYKAAFGAEEIYRLGGTDAREDAVRRLAAHGSAGWVEDESPSDGNVSPETLGGSTGRLLLIMEQPHDVVRRAVTLGATEVSPVAEARMAARTQRRPLRSSLGDPTPAWALAAGRGRGRPVKINRSVPPPTVVPVLVYPDVRAAVAFLAGAFGFVERTRIGASHRAQLAVGDDGAVIVADVGGERRPPQLGGASHVVRVRVADVDAAFARARDHGAVVVEAPVDREYGERDCTLEDLAGHRWQLAEAVADVAPEEFGQETVSPWPAYEANTI